MERRRFLGLCGVGAAALAGCAGRNGETQSPGGTATETASPADGASTDTPTAGVLRLAPADLPADGSAVVYPGDLQEWLREAASTDTTLRVHATAAVENPDPPLPTFDRVRLQGPTAAVTGWYGVRAEGGTRYRYKADAAATTAPDDATVTPVADLGPDRRDLAVAAITDDIDGRAFYPETELGEWARTEFFGGYVRYNGTVYQGMEFQQTDAAFFSTECWYVLSLERVSEGEGPTLVLADIDRDIRDTVEELLDERDLPHESATRDADGAPASAVRFFENTDYLLTHAAVLRVTVER